MHISSAKGEGQGARTEVLPKGAVRIRYGYGERGNMETPLHE